MFFTYHSETRKKYLTPEQFYDLVSTGIIAGLAGGRILFLLQADPSLFTHWYSYLLPWNGGFAILGALVGAVAGIWGYTKYYKIPLVPLLDIASLYAPLAQSIARWGCFFAGCCHGRVIEKVLYQGDPSIIINQPNLSPWWSTVYTHPDSLAPLYTPLYPTQIMMSALSFSLFLVLFFGVRKYIKKFNGSIFFAFFALESLSRFFIDYWRGDRTHVTHTLSFYQYTGLLLALVSAIIWLILYTEYGSQTGSRSHKNKRGADE